MKILIKVTKEVLRRAMMCGVDPNKLSKTTNCGLAEAVREIMPKAAVSFFNAEEENPVIYPLGYYSPTHQIRLPFPEATNFMLRFDHSTPTERIAIPEQSFEIDLPDWVIESIGIGEVYRILSESKTLELVDVIQNP